MHPVARQLAMMDAQQSGVEVDIGLAQPEQLAHPEAGVGQHLQQRSMGAGTVENLRESVPSRIATRSGVRCGFSPGSRRATGCR